MRKIEATPSVMFYLKVFHADGFALLRVAHGKRCYHIVLKRIQYTAKEIQGVFYLVSKYGSESWRVTI